MGAERRSRDCGWDDEVRNESTGNYRGFKTDFRVRTAYARKVVSRKLVDSATVPVDGANVQFKKSIAGICSERP